MNETETTDLEHILRTAVVGHWPAAPDALLDFIEAVPTRERRSGPIGRFLEGRTARQGILGLAAAAAVVVALVGSAALMSSRKPSVPANEPSNVSDGWAWQATDGTLYTAALEVPKGFIAACGRNSGQTMVDWTLCSSPDGLHWSVPADPAIVSIEGDGPFLPTGFLVRGGTYLVVSSPLSGEHQSPATTLWRSTDGVHWNVVTRAPELAQTEIHLAGVAPDGFLALGTRNGTEEMLISADGLTWSKASDMPYGPAVAGASYYWGRTIAAGLFVGGPRPGGTVLGTWRTIDGRTWQDVALPTGFDELSMVAVLPDGSLRAVALSYDGSKPNAIVTSVDGLAWQLDPAGPAGSVDALAVVGDRMVASVSVPANADRREIWRSDDWGKTWRPLLDLSGKPVSGTISYGGELHLGITGPDYIVHWLLTPVGANPGASPIESATVPVSAMASWLGDDLSSVTGNDAVVVAVGTLNSR